MLTKMTLKGIVQKTFLIAAFVIFAIQFLQAVQKLTDPPQKIETKSVPLKVKKILKIWFHESPMILRIL